MFNRKHIITVLLVFAFIAVIYLALNNQSQHGDPVLWEKKHAEVSQIHEREGKLDQFCLDCHWKEFKQTKENFCNQCHRQRKVKLVYINKRG